MTDYRAELDATVTFLNGGGLTTQGFRVDVPSAEVSEQQGAELFDASWALLMVDRVELSNLEDPDPAGDFGVRLALRGRHHDSAAARRHSPCRRAACPARPARRGPDGRPSRGT